MRNRFSSCLIIALVVTGCAPQKNSPILGAWKLVHATWVHRDTLIGEFPGTWSGNDIKMWSKDYFVFVGRVKSDTTFSDSYGGGRYTLEGNRYTEYIQFHAWKPLVGDSARMILEINNDTLVQTWPVQADGQIDKSNFRRETYVRVD